TGTPRAVKVSWNRPYADRGAGQLLEWEVYFVRWLERSGYDVKYSTDVDTHENSARLLQSKAFLSVGHDGHWSKPMYDGVQQARDAGVNLGFFGAGAVFQQVRFEPSPLNGIIDRVMVAYQDRTIDPVQGPTTTVLWRDPPVNRPEQQLIGVQFSGEKPYSPLTQPPYVVANSSSWVYAGTGLADGDSIPRLVGYEMDSSMSNFPLPTSVAGTYQVLSQSPFTDSGGASVTANSSIYQAPSGAWVFGAGPTSWGWGLDLDGFVDPRIQRITANLLNRFVGLSSLATPPTVAIDKAAGQADPTSASPINFTAVFSAPVSGFSGDGVAISGSAGGAKTVTVSGGPSTYLVAVSGMSSSGTVIASIPAGAARDTAGNANSASTSTNNSVTFTYGSPIVLENQQPGSGNWQMWLRGIPPAD